MNYADPVNKGFLEMESVSEMGCMTVQNHEKSGERVGTTDLLGRSRQCLQGLSRVEFIGFIPLQMPSGEKQQVR